MDDGSEEEFGPGDISLLPSGHDAWVVGDDPVVVIDVSGMADYAKEDRDVFFAATRQIQFILKGETLIF